MGSYYRERHQQTIAPTTSDNLAGLGTPPNQPNLDSMTKDQLLNHAHNLGLDVKQSQSKADIRAAIDNAAF